MVSEITACIFPVKNTPSQSVRLERPSELLVRRQHVRDRSPEGAGMIGVEDMREFMDHNVRAKLLGDEEQRRIERDASSSRAAAETALHVSQLYLRDARAEGLRIDPVR